MSEEPTLQVAGHAVRAAALLSKTLWLAPTHESIEVVRASIHEQLRALRMPQRTFSKRKTGRETFGLRCLHDIDELGDHQDPPCADGCVSPAFDLLLKRWSFPVTDTRSFPPLTRSAYPRLRSL
jgi:hypothetical protein